MVDNSCHCVVDFETFYFAVNLSFNSHVWRQDALFIMNEKLLFSTLKKRRLKPDHKEVYNTNK